MVKYLSGRQKLRPSDKLTEDRYKYLGLDQAEPNLADPATSPGVPSGLQYQLVAVTGYEGRRYWVPVGGSLQPGAITIFDEGTPVSSASSITQMNFVGAAVTAQVSLQNPSGHPGIAATVTVIPVNVGDSPPNNPTPNEGELWWESDTGDLYVYYNDGSSAQWVMANAGGRGITGDKGEAGDKGAKGEVGLTGAQGAKGQKGEIGVGQKGEVGGAGDKGQKGEIGAGDKGQKGEIGADGSDGDKGQKGELGTKGEPGSGGGGGASVTISDTAPGSASNGDLWWESDTFDLHVYYQDGSSNQWVSITSNAALKGEKGEKGQKGEVGDKGQKGEVGVKGEKGEIGATGGTGGAGDKGSAGEKGDKGAPSTVAGDKGQKGEVGATGGSGSAGSDGDKGQKGEEGPQGGGAPVGQIVSWSGSAGSLPTGYFLCDGSAVSRSTYAALFAIVGTTHGSGNGSTTFNLPDLRGKFVVGHHPSNGDYDVGDTGGAESVTLTTAQMPSHKHDTTFDNKKYFPGGGSTSVSYGGAGGYPADVFSMSNQGGGQAHENRPPFYALCYIIQFAQGGTTAKGQKGEQGATGSGGSTGDKGQKGASGDKGAASSVQGPTGDKGQKGEVGAQGTGGSTGSAGAKGQKGEVGATGSGGSQGQKGATGAGDKGQKGEVGESGMGLNTKTSAYTLQASDEQKLITTTAAITVPSGVFSASDAVTIYNNSGSGFYINQGSGATLYLAGTNTTGNHFLAGRGIATIVCVATNTFVITGGGIT